MDIIVVDDKSSALGAIKTAIEESLPDSTFHRFGALHDALQYAKTNKIDIAFLDIDMKGMDGLQLAKHLKEIYVHTNVVLATWHRQYAVDAVNLHASGYILKPVTKDAVLSAIGNLRDPVVTAKKILRAQCFGNFEVFVDDVPLTFVRSKTKELLAYLIYRNGAVCNNREIIAAIWENNRDTDALKSYFRHLVADLNRTLKLAEVQDVIYRQFGAMAVLPKNIQCDLYDFLKGQNVSEFKGEFMAQYSWGELSIEYLNRISQQI